MDKYCPYTKRQEGSMSGTGATRKTKCCGKDCAIWISKEEMVFYCIPKHYYQFDTKGMCGNKLRALRRG